MHVNKASSFVSGVDKNAIDIEEYKRHSVPMETATAVLANKHMASKHMTKRACTGYQPAVTISRSLSLLSGMYLYIRLIISFVSNVQVTESV